MSPKALKKLVIFSVFLNLLTIFSFLIEVVSPYKLRGKTADVDHFYFILVVLAIVVSLVSVFSLIFAEMSRLNKLLYAVIHLLTFAPLIGVTMPPISVLSILLFDADSATDYVEYVSPTGGKSIVYEYGGFYESFKSIRGYSNILILHKRLETRQLGPETCSELIKYAHMTWNSREDQVEWGVSISSEHQKCTIKFD